MSIPSVYRRADSHWWWIARTAVDADGIRRRYLLSGRALGLDAATHTRKQAQAAVDAYYHFDSDTIPAEKSLTVAWMHDTLLARFERECMNESTLREYYISLRHFADAVGPGTLLIDLTHMDVVHKEHEKPLQRIFI